MTLRLGFSPCPNDTFIFDALVNKKIDTEGLDFEVMLEDVQTLNEWALSGKLDIIKISYGVLPKILKTYIVLNSGGALGKGVGPLLVSKKENENFPIQQQGDLPRLKNERIALPGEHTTANMLFSIAYPEAINKKFMVFSAIENAVLNNEVDYGVLIHENRFTYQEKGLIKIIDLGEYWEQQTGLPIPLGAIVIKRTIEYIIQKKIDRLIKQSIEYAFEHYPQLTDYVKKNSQEMNEMVMRQHIDLYVNNYSIQLGYDGKAAVIKMMECINSNEREQTVNQPLFLE